ncbi:trypsin-like [Anticarsia gemmatalis]|uniref:trypsin-like n=1 Tax=Anticarsia gemmatalis TaxID=129554 RepID=UPI003F770950
MWCLIFMFVVTVAEGSVKLPEPVPEDVANSSETPMSPIHARIVGGVDTTIQKYPFAVQIQYHMQLWCGGTLVTKRHVLSAAHCFVSQKDGKVASPDSFSVRVGTATLGTRGTVQYVSMILTHGAYNRQTQNNDVAVLMLSLYVTLSPEVQVAYVPIPGEIVPDKRPVVAVGWGNTNYTETHSNQHSAILKEVTLATVSRKLCARQYHMQSSDMRNMICAGRIWVGGADTCQGDSGGPLVYQNVVVGITSWGQRCGDPRHPGVYTKVAAYTSWINNTIIYSLTNGATGSRPASNSVLFISLLIPLAFKMLSVKI